jgi:hypothetical protein
MHRCSWMGKAASRKNRDGHIAALAQAALRLSCATQNSGEGGRASMKPSIRHAPRSISQGVR